MMAADLKKLDRILIGITLLITLASTFWAMSYLSQKQKEIEIQSTLFEDRLKEMNMADQTLTTMKRFLTETEKTLYLLNERIPKEGSIGKFLNQLDELMGNFDITLISVRPLLPIEMNTFLKVPITLKAKGEFTMLMKMIHQLEKMNRLVMLEKLSLKKSPREALVFIDLTIGVFEKKEGE